MKLRHGFVSNSSTSSFVIAKVYMTEKQMQQFRDWIEDNQEDWYEGYLGETDYYFQGELGHCAYDDLYNFLKEIGINRKYVGDYC